MLPGPKHGPLSLLPPRTGPPGCSRRGSPLPDTEPAPLAAWLQRGVRALGAHMPILASGITDTQTEQENCCGTSDYFCFKRQRLKKKRDKDFPKDLGTQAGHPRVQTGMQLSGERVTGVVVRPASSPSRAALPATGETASWEGHWLQNQAVWGTESQLQHSL